MNNENDHNRGRASGQEEVAERNQGLAQPPSISLPKGGGAIRGIVEKIVASPVTGSGTLTIPIAASPGRSILVHNSFYPTTPALVRVR